MMSVIALTGCSGASSAGPAKHTSFAFWPLPPDEPRIQFVRSFQTSADLSDKRPSRLDEIIFGKDNPRDTSIDKPYGVEMRNGRIYVCDIRYPALTVLDLTNKQMRRIGTTGINHLTHPVDVAVADDGWVYVVDNDRNAVLVYDENERYAKTLGHKGLKPIAAAVHGERLYVCDITAQHIVILDRHSGELLGTFGSVGDGDGQFRVPLSIDIDAQGYVYVSDMMRCRVQKFSPDGGFISGFGELGDYAGSFARPKQLAVDSEGIVYVVDAAFQNVQMFNKDYELLMSFGSAGAYPGAMNLPVGVCVSDERLELVKDDIHEGFIPTRYVVVTNQFGFGKVNIYALGHLRKGWTVADLEPASVTVNAGVGDMAEGRGRNAATAPVPDEYVPEEASPEQNPNSPSTGDGLEWQR